MRWMTQASADPATEQLVECQLCGAEIRGPTTCDRCSAVYYCCQKHRKKHWKLGHSEECTRFKQQLLQGKVC